MSPSSCLPFAQQVAELLFVGTIAIGVLRLPVPQIAAHRVKILLSLET
jgi:hypothetical protein